MARAALENPSRIGVCVDADELFGAPTGIRSCAEIMRQFDFRATLFRLSFVRHGNDSLFGNEPLSDEESLQKFAHILSAIAGPRTVVAACRLASELLRTGNFYAFSDQALAATMELAGLCCPRNGGRTFGDPSDLDALSRVVFSFQGASLSPQFKRFARAGSAWDVIPESFLAELVRNNLAHNPLGSPGNAIARLYAIATEQRIADYFHSRTGESLDAWFQRRLGMTAAGFMRAAFLVGCCAARYGQVAEDLGALGIIESVVLAQLERGDQDNVRRLLNLAKLSETALGHARSLEGGLTGFLYDSTSLRIRPIIDMGDCYLPATLTGVLEKFIVGIPHVLDEAARAVDPSADIGQVRLKFGHVFERYLGVLFEDWLAERADVQVLIGFRENPESPDWDVIVTRGDTAYYFEAKAKVFVLGMRTNGAFESLDRMLLGPIRETWLGAQRLLAAAQQDNAPEPLRAIRRVVPCLVVFDRIPIRFPYLDRYERHVESELGIPVFSPTGNTLSPLQTFEIEGVESWEQWMDMTPSSDALFDYLNRRACDPLTRHDRKFPVDRPNSSRTPNGPSRRFLDESKRLFEQMEGQIRFNREVSLPVRE